MADLQRRRLFGQDLAVDATGRGAEKPTAGDLMAETLERLKVQLEHLSAEDKAELAHFLLRSLEPDEEGVAAAWDLEIARRVDEIRSGRASGTPAEEVFAELRREYP